MKKRITSLKPLIFWLIYVGVIIACVVIDQLTKYFIEIAVANNGPIPILGDWLTIVWTTNDGATGGIFSEMENRNILFFAMTVIGLPIFFYLLWRSRIRSVWGQVAFAFMIGGTVGNAIDRLFLAKNGFFTGAVRDFVQVEHFFGIFNMADSFLVVGVILALLAIVFFDHDSLVASIMDEHKSKQQHKTADLQQTTESKTDDKPKNTENSDNADN